MDERRSNQAAEPDDQKPVTQKVLVETLHVFRRDIQKDIYAAIDERVPMILGQFTDEVLMPSIAVQLRETFAKYQYDLKNYLDEKVAELRGDRVRIQKFLEKLVEVLRRRRLCSEDEIRELMRYIPEHSAPPL
ncbi:MAG: hypothetical protein Q7R80_00900 [bacterium]|nr:hypothetical protein [bacterium]